MNRDSINLLKSINSGCKNATNSIEQTLEFVREEKLREVLKEYDKKHVEIGDESHKLLENYGASEEDPSAMAKAMTWITTEIKMLTDATDSHVAQLMMDGCNMGMKNIVKDCGRYSKADHDVFAMAGHLVNLEDEMYSRMMGFI